MIRYFDPFLPPRNYLDPRLLIFINILTPSLRLFGTPSRLLPLFGTRDYSIGKLIHARTEPFYGTEILCVLMPSFLGPEQTGKMFIGLSYRTQKIHASECYFFPFPIKRLLKVGKNSKRRKFPLDPPK